MFEEQAKIRAVVANILFTRYRLFSVRSDCPFLFATCLAD